MAFSVRLSRRGENRVSVDAVRVGKGVAGDFAGRAIGLERGVGGIGGGEVADQLHVRKDSREGAQAQNRKGRTDCLTTNGITQWGDSLGAVPANGLHDQSEGRLMPPGET